LNKVELLESSITSHFSTGENKIQGAIGKDYRVKYSLIAFSGVVSGKRAQKTKLKNEDIELLDEAMKNAIPELVTRSKIGQYPRLYMRVEYKDDETILGDLRDYISLKQTEESIRDIRECELEIDELVDFLNKNKDRIKCINYHYDERLKLSLKGENVEFKQAFSNIEIKEI
jgi:CRISPR-associated protein Csh2